MRGFVIILSVLVGQGNACWYQSKDKPFRHITSFLKHHGMDGKPWDPSIGITRKCLDHVVKDAPSGIGWLVKKVHGVDGVFNDCDTNGDGLIYIDEARHAKKCVDSCWKHVAVQTFLN